MTELNHLCIAIIAMDGFEESELVLPMNALKAKGAQVDVLAPKPEIQGFNRMTRSNAILAHRLIENAQASDYDALVLPGGALSTDFLRSDPIVLEFVKQIQAQAKPIAAIDHAAWILVSTGLVRGRKLTAFHTLRDDIRNAGGEWLNEEVVLDRNWVTSRTAEDMAAFNREMIALFSRSTPSIIQVAESA